MPPEDGMHGKFLSHSSVQRLWMPSKEPNSYANLLSSRGLSIGRMRFVVVPNMESETHEEGGEGGWIVTTGGGMLVGSNGDTAEAVKAMAPFASPCMPNYPKRHISESRCETKIMAGVWYMIACTWNALLVGDSNLEGLCHQYSAWWLKPTLSMLWWTTLWQSWVAGSITIEQKIMLCRFCSKRDIYLATISVLRTSTKKGRGGGSPAGPVGLKWKIHRDEQLQLHCIPIYSYEDCWVNLNQILLCWLISLSEAFNFYLVAPKQSMCCVMPI